MSKEIIRSIDHAAGPRRSNFPNRSIADFALTDNIEELKEAVKTATSAHRDYLRDRAVIKIGSTVASCTLAGLAVHVETAHNGFFRTTLRTEWNEQPQPLLEVAEILAASLTWADSTPREDPNAYVCHAVAMLADKLDDEAREATKRARIAAESSRVATELAERQREREREHDGWYAAVSAGGYYGPRGPWKTLADAKAAVSMHARRMGAEWGTIVAMSSVRIRGPFTTRKEAKAANICDGSLIACTF